MNWLHFHKWEKWSHPYNGIGGKFNSDMGFFVVSQIRLCATCGIAEVRRLPELRHINELKEELK